jgi:hypothetical protein
VGSNGLAVVSSHLDLSPEVDKSDCLGRHQSLLGVLLQ